MYLLYNFFNKKKEFFLLKNKNKENKTPYIAKVFLKKLEKIKNIASHRILTSKTQSL